MILKKAGITFLLVVGVVLIGPDQALAADTGCDPADVLIGTCADASIRNGGVDVTASHNAPGSGSTKGSGSANGSGSSAPKPPSTPPVVRAPNAIYDDQGNVFRDGFTVTRPVTLADLINFKPVPGVDHMEPNGWMIVGLDTNFYATVTSDIQQGELLGKTASVRFTPLRYHWRYGDGSSAALRTKGATWAAQGAREFDRTPTSHVYARQGSYDIDLTIDFGAEYRYADSGWIPIAGTLPVPANRLHASAGDAKTVLVQRECTVKPTGPGC